MRTETMSISEFMGREPKVKKVKSKAVIPVVLAPFTFIPVAAIQSAKAQAAPIAVPANAVSDAVSDKTLEVIAHALDPVVDIITAFAFPLASVAIAGACLMVMVGNRDKAIERVSNIAIGYCAIQLLPFGLEILKGIGDSL